MAIGWPILSRRGDFKLCRGQTNSHPIAAAQLLAAWLRDAHAMGGQAETLLKTQIERLKNYPDALPRLNSHLAGTKQQRAAIEQPEAAG